jgi:hypothetical protein
MVHIKRFEAFFLTEEKKEEEYSEKDISEIIGRIHSIIELTNCGKFKIGKTGEKGFDRIDAPYNDEYNCYFTISKSDSKKKIDHLEHILIKEFKHGKHKNLCDNISEAENHVMEDKGYGYSVYLIFNIS